MCIAPINAKQQLKEKHMGISLKRPFTFPLVRISFIEFLTGDQ